jgi:HlyD family secretion protein
MKKIIRYLFIVLLLASFAGMAWYLYQKSKPAPEVSETAEMKKATIIKKTVATGSIIPRKEVNIKSQVSGVVEKLYVTAGERVSEGQVIAKIKLIPNAVTLSNAENNVKTATINYENAKREFERYKKLFEQRMIAETEYIQYKQQFDLRSQEKEVAENNFDLIRKGASEKTGKVWNLVKSTVNGMILDVPVKEGGFVIESNTFNDGTTIASVANMNEMIFEGKLDESEVGKIALGMPLEIKVGALEKDKFLAKLEYIAPKGVTEDGAIKFVIRAAVKLSSDRFLRAGYSANADIVLAKRDSVYSLPESFLQYEGDKIFVEIEDKKTEVRKQYIKTGISDGINAEIIEGIKAGDKIRKPKGV